MLGGIKAEQGQAAGGRAAVPVVAGHSTQRCWGFLKQRPHNGVGR